MVASWLSFFVYGEDVFLNHLDKGAVHQELCICYVVGDV